MNCRVDIDYTMEKPKIKFSYTTNKPKKQVIKQHRLNTPFIILLWSLFCIFYYLYYNTDYSKLSLLVLFLSIVIVHYLGLPNLLLRCKWYVKGYPERQARGKERRYYKFTNKDVENNIVEIQQFGNIILIYKTYGDFDKYLTYIKIREHKYHNYKLRGFGKRKKWVIGKLKREEYTWYARFYFRKKPLKGYLEVIYK